VSYEIRLVRSAERELNRLTSAEHDRISGRILSLGDNPRPRGIKKLSNREEYRLRAGDYRVLYTIDEPNSVVTVLSVGHRREVYR
jgi:mRNA interferase RelE/StbE